MELTFGESLKKLRIEKGLSQQELADMAYVSRSSVTRWETNRRIPDAITIMQLSKIFGVDVNTLLKTFEDNDSSINIIMVDDNSVVLKGGIEVIKKILPNADVKGFTSPGDAINYARINFVDIAFLDIEMGQISGLKLCKMLLDIDPKTNVFYLTAYPDYALDAWKTGACGFMEKPINADEVKESLKLLRHPITGLVTE